MVVSFRTAEVWSGRDEAGSAPVVGRSLLTGTLPRASAGRKLLPTPGPAGDPTGRPSRPPRASGTSRTLTGRLLAHHRGQRLVAPAASVGWSGGPMAAPAVEGSGRTAQLLELDHVAVWAAAGHQ